MASVVLVNTVEARMVFSYGGRVMINAYSVLCGAVPTPAMLVSIAQVFDAWDNATMKPQRVNSCTLTGITCQSWHTLAAPFYQLSPFVARPGTFSTSARHPAASESICVRLQTGLRGKAYRGRVYLFGYGTNVYANVREIAAVSATNYAGYIMTLRANLAAAGFTLAVASRYQGYLPNGRPAPRAVGIVTPVTSAVANIRLCVQRRRLGKQSN